MNCVPVVIVDLTNKAYILYMIFDDWLTWTSYLKICLMGESRQLEQNYRCGCRNVMNVLRLFHHNTEWIKVD